MKPKRKNNGRCPGLDPYGTGDIPENLLVALGGRRENVLNAWRQGALAEVPTGVAFDVLRMPEGLAPFVLARMREDGVRLGPVLLGPHGAEFLIRTHTMWDLTPDDKHVELLSEGQLVLLPPPTVLAPQAEVGKRAWLVPLTYHPADCPVGHGVAWGAEMRESYEAALADFAKVAAASSSEG